MKQRIKKVIAFICAITMIVSSVTIYSKTANADGETSQTSQSDETEAAGYTELSYEAFLLGDTGQNQYKAVCGKGSINKIVNIQQYGAAKEAGIYISFRDADIGTISVNGADGDAFIDGAGVIIYLSNFEYMYSDVVVKTGGGEQKAVIYVYNAKGIDNSDKAILQPGKDGETSANITLSDLSEFGRYITFGSYRVLKSSDKTVEVGLDPINGDHLKIRNASGPGGQQSQLTVLRTFTGLTAGKRYVLSFDITPSVAKGTYTTVMNSTPQPLKEGTTTVSIVTKAYGEGKADFSIQLNGMDADVILDIYNPQSREYVEGEETDSATQTPTSENVTDPATQTPTSENATVPETQTPTSENATNPINTTPTVGNTETTTVPTTVGQNETTVAPTAATNEVKAPAKVKISKVTAKKKSAKKVSLVLKKVNGAKGYQVAVYTTKKNAKNNKKAIVKKFVKKVSSTINSKKLKNKNKLYVKARAYVLDTNGKKVYGKWSKVKKVKIKK